MNVVSVSTASTLINQSIHACHHNELLREDMGHCFDSDDDDDDDDYDDS
jgi:hypothetical protein